MTGDFEIKILFLLPAKKDVSPYSFVLEYILAQFSF